MMVAAMLAGGAYGAIPGILKAVRGVNEIIVTLMLNYIAALWISYWVFGPWSEGGFQLTPQFPPRGLAAPPLRPRRGDPSRSPG